MSFLVLLINYFIEKYMFYSVSTIIYISHQIKYKSYIYITSNEIIKIVLKLKENIIN